MTDSGKCDHLVSRWSKCDYLVYGFSKWLDELSG